MIFLIIYAVIITVLLGIAIHDCYKSRLEVKAVKANTTFSNTLPRRHYNKMAEYLRTRKSKFSLASKIEIMSMWNNLLLQLPRSVKETLDTVPETIDMDTNTLTAAEHKKAMIEALEALAQQDDINNDDLVKACYHLYYIIFM